MRYQLHQFGIRRVGEPNKYLTSPGDTVKELNALSRHLSAERAAREQAERETVKWRAAIQRITPGGSEFMSPEAVEAWAAKVFREMGDAKMARVRAERERDEWEKKNAHNVALYERELSDARRALVWFAAHCAEPDWARAAVRAARGEKQKEVVDGE